MKTMIHSRAIHVIVLATVLLIADAVAQKSEPATVDFFPLRTGDSWTYRSTSGGTDLKRRVLSEEKQADGTTRYLVETSMGTRIQTVFSKVNGWVLMHAERYPDQERLEPEFEPPKQYLPHPLVAGSKWEGKGRDPTQPEREEVNQAAGIEKITVPAGQFQAMKVVTHTTGSNGMSKTCWYADGVGLIKQAIEEGGKKSGWELIDYSFKKKDTGS